jgi:Ca-activated chloride channel family protein
MRPKTSDRRWSRFSIFKFLVILCFPLLIITYPQDAKDIHEQDRPRQSKPALEAAIARESKEQEKGFTIGVNVDLVLMYASVFDKKGDFVGGLKEDNFKVYEDGVEQKVASFSREDVPASMGILLDLSGSMKGKIDQVNKAALAFIRASNPQDQVFLIGFNDEVELLQDFTSDIDEVTDSLDNALVMGGTSLYDAIYLGVQKAQTGKKPKKAIVVITDGEDRDSYYNLNELLTKVQESDVQVFCVGFLNPSGSKGFFGRWSKSASDQAHDALVRISEETGGKAYFPDKVTDIHTIVAEIATEIRSQYSLGYFSSNSARDGSFRRVKIQLVGQHIEDNYIRYRRGYYAPKDELTRK